MSRRTTKQRRAARFRRACEERSGYRPTETGAVQDLPGDVVWELGGPLLRLRAQGWRASTTHYAMSRPAWFGYIPAIGERR